MSRTLTRRAPVAALALGSLVMAACGGGDDDDTTVTAGGIEVTSFGSETGRIQLPGTAEVGQTGSSSVSVSTSVDLSGPVDQSVSVAVRLELATEVVSADADGYVVEAEYTGGETLDAPPEADLDAISNIVGVRYRQSFAADGTGGEPELIDEGSLTDAQRTAFEEFGAEAQATSFAFPAELLGEGATWTATSTIESQGLEIDVPYEYELTSVDGDNYEIDVTYDTDVDEQMSLDGVGDVDATGSVTGGGTLRGSVTNPLLQASTIDQEMDLDLDADGEVLSMVVNIAIEAAPA